MAFKGQIKTPIIIDHEDNTYAYLSLPARTRVNKTTGVIEVQNVFGKVVHDWSPAKFFKTITEGSKVYNPGHRAYQLRFTRGKQTFSAPRVVATVCVPNPNKFEYVMPIDRNPDNLDPSNLKWVDRREYRRQSSNARPFTEEELKILESIPLPHTRFNKEYMKFLNERKDEYGMTKARRFYYKKQGRLEEVREFSKIKPTDSEI